MGFHQEPLKGIPGILSVVFYSNMYFLGYAGS